MKHLSVGEAAYLAGLIDGEGTISIYRSVQPRYRNGYNYRPVIEISNTHEGVLRWIADLIGDGWLKETNPGNVERKGHRPLYRFRFRTIDCRWVLPQIRPYLKIKAQQADILMDYFDRVHNTRPILREETENLTRQLNVLNHRGSDLVATASQ